MTGRDFLFGFKFLATDYVSPVLKNIESRIEAVNTQVKNTERWRTAGTNMIVLGAGIGAAGGAIGVGLMSALDAASKMQGMMTHVATAISDGAATQRNLAAAQAMAEKTSIASGIAATQEAQAYYTARSNALDHAQAMAAVQVATKLVIGTTDSLAKAQEQLNPTTRLLTGVFQTFGDKTGDVNKQIVGYGDQLSKLQTHYAFQGQEEVNYAMQYAIPISKAAGVAFSDQNAALALLSEGHLQGAEAGTAYAEMLSKLTAGGKLRAYTALTKQGGIDLGQTVARLSAATAGLSASQRALFLHQVGFSERNVRGIAILIDKTAQYKSIVADLNNSQGANAAAYATREASMEAATARLAATWDVLKSKIGEQLLGPMTRVTTVLTSVVTRLADFATAHPAITKYIATFTAIGAAVAVVVGGALLMTGAFFAAISYLPAMAAVTGVVSAALGGLATAAGVAWAAITGPVGLAVGAIALVGVGVYEVIKHWSSITKFCVGLASTMYQAGANLIKSLAAGIMSAVHWAEHSIAAVGAAIRAHLPFSPAKVGPLRDLNRVRIVETIADTIRPGPALNAIRRAGAAMAIAAPLVFSSPMTSSALASSAGGARGGGITIQVHQEIHIDGATAGDERKLMEALGRHGRELGQIIEAQLRHNARREF